MFPGDFTQVYLQASRAPESDGAVANLSDQANQLKVEGSGRDADDTSHRLWGRGMAVR